MNIQRVKIANYKSNLSKTSGQSFNISAASLKFPCQIISNAVQPANLGISYYLLIITALIIIALITLVSNGLFLIVVLRSKRLHTNHNLMLISLSVSDFLTGIIVTPINAISFIYVMNEKYPCWLFWLRTISFHAVSTISLSTLLFISFEKYLAIMYTYYYQRVVTKRKITLIVVGVWIFGISLALIGDLIGLSYPKIRRFLWTYVTYLGVVFYTAIFYFYGRIFREIQKVKRRIAIENTFQSDDSVVRESSKAAKTMVVIIGVLSLCYLPLITAYIMWPPNQTMHSPGLKRSELLVKPITIVTVLSSAAMNPAIYYVRMSSVRREFKRIFCLRRTSA